MIKRVQSFLLFFLITIDRLVDHAWRSATGLPQARRSAITPDVYLGGQYGVRSIPMLQKLGITAIVNMREHMLHPTGKAKTFTILHLPTQDHHAPTLEQLQQGVTFIDKVIKKGGKVYIHCHWGEERGPTMTIAYLIATGMTYDDAYTLVKKTRPFIHPVPSQVARLKEFEKAISQKQS